MSPRSEEQYEAIREKSRQKIIDAALQLFANNGYHSTSMSAIAKGAGISKGLIYNYFESKEELLIAIFKVGLQQADDIFEAHHETDPCERLKGMIVDSFTMVKANQDYYRLLEFLMLQPQVIAGVTESLNQTIGEKIVVAVQLFTELGYEDPMNEAIYLDAAMHGMMLGYYVMGDAYPLDAMQDKLIAQYCTQKDKK